MQLKDQAQRDLDAAQARVDCLAEKISLCQHVIEGNCADDCNPLN